MLLPSSRQKKTHRSSNALGNTALSTLGLGASQRASEYSGMTGIELLEAMNAEGLKTKFGFITTEATADMRAKATAGGAKFLISKPFSVESFQKVLSAIM